MFSMRVKHFARLLYMISPPLKVSVAAFSFCFQNHEFAKTNPAMVAEWSETLVQIPVAISPLKTQVQIWFWTKYKYELLISKLMLHINIIHRMVIFFNILTSFSVTNAEKKRKGKTYLKRGLPVFRHYS